MIVALVTFLMSVTKLTKMNQDQPRSTKIHQDQPRSAKNQDQDHKKLTKINNITQTNQIKNKHP